jgi:hypothetical protein
MSPTDTVSSGLVKNFGEKIESELKSSRFSNYDSGDEVAFIDDTVDLLDRKYAYDGQQVLNVKCKKAHASPKVQFGSLGNYGKQSVELADILVVLNYWRNGIVSHRQSFFSQAKCVKKSQPGYLRWDIDESQYALLHERPAFQLEHKEAEVTHDLSDTAGSFFNFSFASETHRPFFYKTGDMEKYIDWSYATPRFYYGKNPPYGNRFLFSVLKNTIRGRYGAGFDSGDAEYLLLEEVYEHAKLERSDSSNSVPSGSKRVTDGGSTQTQFAIVNIDIDLDGSVVGLSEYFQEYLTEENEPSEGTEADIAGTIRSAFDGADSDGLHFDGI